MTKIRLLVFVAFLITSWSTNAQDVGVLGKVDSTALSSLDSLEIFDLIDSLLNTADDPSSQFVARVSYNSNVLSAGRTLGIQNFGLAPGVSYYHKTGLYTDVTAYWSKDFHPEYYLTIGTVGYMKDLTKHVSFIAEYDRYFYHVSADQFVPYRNTASITPMIEFKPLTFSINYAYYFGDQDAHRILPGLNITLQKKKWLGFRKISINPSFYALFGNETLYGIEMVAPTNLKERLRNLYLYGTPYRVVETQHNVFGLMNYSVSCPLTFSYKSFNLTVNYTYSVPKALDGEPLTISESHYLSGSLSYYLDTRRFKKAL